MIREDIVKWAAGFFDGEGSVLISKSLTNYQDKYHRLVWGLKVKAVQTKEAPLRLFLETFGGTLVKYEPRRENWKAGWIWEVRGKKAKQFLLEVLPYLQVKHEQAKLALEFPLGKEHNANIPRVTIERLRIYNSIRKLNQTGTGEYVPVEMNELDLALAHNRDSIENKQERKRIGQLKRHYGDKWKNRYYLLFEREPLYGLG